MARTPKHTSSALVAKSPWSSLPLVGICGVLVAGCMFLGAPAAAENVTDDRDPVASVASEPSGSDSADDGMELIGSYEAISQSSNENRIENIRLASEAIDGTVIEPGETFSFNEAVGDTESDERYLEAPIISDDVTVNGRGGGICQVSTALYIAALKADLEIVEHHSHTLVSDYAPIGLDATVSYGQLDLRIKNTSGHPIKLVVRPLGQSVTVEIQGQPLSEGTSVDATSKIIERYEITPDEAQEGIGESQGTYYVAESYRVYYDNGVKKESVLLSTDTYKVEDDALVSLGEGSVGPTK